MLGMAKAKEEGWASVMRLSNPEHRERLARLEAAMSVKLGGARVPRAQVLAAVIEAGLAVVERDFGIKRR
jgi:hypothetical protein